MLETSKDILNLLLGISVFVVATMLSVLLYNLIMIIRNFRNLSKSIREKVEALDSLLITAKEVLHTVQEKLEHSTAYIGILIELVTKIVSYMKNDKTDGNHQLENKQETRDKDTNNTQ